MGACVSIYRLLLQRNQDEALGLEHRGNFLQEGPRKRYIYAAELKCRYLGLYTVPESWE